MSPGSRIWKRGRVSAIASLSSTPREPLLFLYPPWIRNSSTATAALRQDQDGSSLIPPISGGNRPALIDSQRLRIEISKVSPTDTSSNRSENKILCSESSYSTVPAGPSNATTDIHPPSVPKIRHHSANGMHQKLNKIGEKVKLNEERERSVRNAYQLSQLRSYDPDWRVVLDTLSRHTPENEKWLDRALTVVVPESTLDTFLYGVDDNLWNIGERYGCSIEVKSRDSDSAAIKRRGLENKHHRSFLLSGNATAISKTAADILQIAPNADLIAETKGNLLTALEAKDSRIATSYGPRTGAARTVLSESRWRPPITRADKIPRPEKWTQESFVEYVTDLTSVEMPNHIHRLMYEDNQSQVLIVLSILREIFQDPDCRSSISLKACNTAMQYFVKRSNIADARILFVHMEILKLRMDVETFNIMLRAAAKSEDLHNFSFVLHLMLRRGISPNVKTWTSFLMLHHDIRIKLYIVDTMKKRGLLPHISAIKAVCEHLVTQETFNSIDLGQKQDEFLRHMDSRYGPSWLSLDSGNRILNVLALRGLISRSFDFLYVMTDRSVFPDAYSVNTILNRCKQLNNVVGAVEIMKNLPPVAHFVPNEMTYHVLFELAWRERAYNLAKVVWKYACLNGLTTWRMRKLVLSSLKAFNSQTSIAKNSHERWKQMAGIFITAQDPPFAPNHPCTGETGSKTLSPLAGVLPDSTTNSSKPPFMDNIPRETHKEILEREILLFQEWRPVRPLADLLEEAWARDKQWGDCLNSQGMVSQNPSLSPAEAIIVPRRSAFEGGS